MIQLNCPLLRGLKYLLTKVYAPIIERFGINVRSLQQIKNCIGFILLMGFGHVKLEENGLPKSITHMLDLVNLFPDIEIDSLS